MSASEGGSEGTKPAVHCKRPGDFERFVEALPDSDWALLTIDGAAAVAGDAARAMGAGGGDVFDAGRFHTELRTKALGRVLMHGERMESTQARPARGPCCSRTLGPDSSSVNARPRGTSAIAHS